MSEQLIEVLLGHHFAETVILLCLNGRAFRGRLSVLDGSIIVDTSSASFLCCFQLLPIQEIIVDMHPRCPLGETHLLKNLFLGLRLRIKLLKLPDLLPFVLLVGENLLLIKPMISNISSIRRPISPLRGIMLIKHSNIGPLNVIYSMLIAADPVHQKLS